MKHMTQFTARKTQRLSTQHQAGMSFIGLVFWVAFLGSVILIGLQVTPIVNEYISIKSAIKKSKSEGDARAIRSAFDRYAQATYINDFDSSLLNIDTKNGRTTVSFEYARKLHLVGPVSLLFNFSGEDLVQ